MISPPAESGNTRTGGRDDRATRVGWSAGGSRSDGVVSFGLGARVVTHDDPRRPDLSTDLRKELERREGERRQAEEWARGDLAVAEERKKELLGMTSQFAAAMRANRIPPTDELLRRGPDDRPWFGWSKPRRTRGPGWRLVNWAGGWDSPVTPQVGVFEDGTCLVGKVHLRPGRPAGLSSDVLARAMQDVRMPMVRFLADHGIGPDALGR
jgi:hypothetical protein